MGSHASPAPITCEILSPLLCFSVISVSLRKLAHSLTAFLDSRDKWYSQPLSYLNLWNCYLFISHLSVWLTKEERGGVCPRPCITWRIHSHWGGSAQLSHTSASTKKMRRKKKKTEIILTHLKRGHGHCWSILESSMNPLHNQLHRQCKAFHRATWKSLHSPSLLSHTNGFISSEKEKQKFKYH